MSLTTLTADTNNEKKTCFCMNFDYVNATNTALFSHFVRLEEDSHNVRKKTRQDDRKLSMISFAEGKKIMHRRHLSSQNE